MTRKGLLTIFGAIALSGFLVHCGQEDTAFTSQDASSFAGKVAGRVVDKKGNAVSGALVTALPGGSTTASGPDGNYELSGLSAGAYHLAFMKSDYLDTSLASSVKVGLLQTDSLGSMQLHSRYATLKGMIGSSGLSAGNSVTVLVENQSSKALAVPGSQFLLGNLDPGTVRLFAVVSGVGYGVKTVHLTAGDTDSVGTLAIDSVGGTVTGKVVNASTNAAVPGAVVATTGDTVYTDGQGSFRLTHVPSTAVLKIVSGDGTQGAMVSGVAVKNSDSISLSPIRLSSLVPNAIPRLENGYAFGKTTDLQIPLIAISQVGTDTAWHIRHYLWSDDGAHWDTTLCNVVYRSPSSLGGVGNHSVSIKARLYKLSGGLLLDSFTTVSTISVGISLPRDTMAPVLKRVSPASDTTTHAWSDSVVTVSWAVSDDRQLGSVVLNGVDVRVDSGKVSLRDTLSLGAITFHLVARDSAGNVARDSVTLIRLPESATDLSLSSLAVGRGTLSPSFSASTLSYTDTLASTDSLLVLTAKSADATALLSIGGTTAVSGKGDTILVKKDTVVSIVVSRGSSALTYTVKVVHKAASASGASASGTFKDARDGQTYKWVTIGTQTWMAQNLNYNTANDTGSWCYNDLSSNCSTYGRLYSWATAMGLDTSYNNKFWRGADSAQHQGICPSGWHVPSDAEWSTLVQYADSATSGTKLKSTNGWSGSGNGTNVFDFCALPSGDRYSDGMFHNLNIRADFWSSLNDAASNAWSRYLYSSDANVIRDTYNVKSSGFSLRCLQNSNIPMVVARDSTLSSLTTSGGGLTSLFSSSALSYTDTVSSGVISVTLAATATAPADVDSIRYNGLSSGVISLSSDTTKVLVAVYNKNKNSLTYAVTIIRTSSSTTGASASGTFTDTRDGQTYKWVTIGSQTWMAQNLNYRNTTGSTDTVGVCYNNSSDSCTKYGRLYSWATAMGLDTSYDNKIWQGVDSAKHQGICPSGWYVPNKTEWSTLIQYVDSVTSGTKLKSTSGWYNSGNGTDIYGFRVLPAGMQSYIIPTFNIEFRGASNGTSFWSSSLGDEFASSTAWSWDFSYGNAYASSDKGSGSVKVNGFSLRCVQGAGSPVSLDTLTTLHSLALDSGTLTTTFDSSVTGYVDSVTSTVTSLKVTATASSTSDIVKVNGTAVTSGTATSVNVSTDTTLTIVVSNPNISSTKTYTVRVVHKVAASTTGASASGTFTDIRDGQTYKWVTIGSQTWMAQNLNYKPSGTDSGWCYDDSSANCATYGRLYTWATAMGLDTSYNNKLWQGADSAKHQGICPSGWHVPTDTEWGTLLAYVGADSARIRLSSTSGWSSGNGTDVYGFDVLSAGCRLNDEAFQGLGSNANFWSSSEQVAFYARYRYFFYSHAYVYSYSDFKMDGFSLRCAEN